MGVFTLLSVILVIAKMNGKLPDISYWIVLGIIPLDIIVPIFIILVWFFVFWFFDKIACKLKIIGKFL